MFEVAPLHQTRKCFLIDKNLRAKTKRGVASHILNLGWRDSGEITGLEGNTV